MRKYLGDYFDDVYRLARSTNCLEVILQRAYEPNDETDFLFCQSVTW